MINEAENSPINEEYLEMQYEIAGKEAYAREAPVRFQTNGMKFVAHPDGHYEQVPGPSTPSAAADEPTEPNAPLLPSLFHFVVPGYPCSYWRSTGAHIVVAGACRCGKRFVLSEQTANPQG